MRLSWREFYFKDKKIVRATEFSEPVYTSRITVGTVEVDSIAGGDARVSYIATIESPDL